MHIIGREQPVDREQAKRQWDSAAPGWARWEPTISAWLQDATQAMLEVAGVAPGRQVIDIACGAGDQSLAAARRVGPSGRVLATDISPAMTAFVAEQAQAAGLDTITTKVTAAEDLSDDAGPFDAAICRLGLMLIPAPLDVLRTVLRVMRPGGRLGAIVIGRPEANPFFSGPLAILRRHAKKPVPPASSPGIFALSDPQALTALLNTAGFAEVSVTTREVPLAMSSAEDAVRMIQDAFGVYRAVIGDQPEDTQRAAWSEVLDCLKQFEGPDGFCAPAQLHIAGGQKPS